MTDGVATSITTEATYENGVLKPASPLPLSDGERVQLTIDVDATQRVNRVRAMAGFMGWKGDAETVERIAMDPEFDINECP